jgi:crotonobetainyl-CoA:carnitine CoA-transferase CaiB-like acyl-CoA transferase
VYCRTYAYGLEGPMSVSGGLDPLYQGIMGLEYEAGGVAHGNPPMYLRFGMTDTANSYASVVGVLTALLHKQKTGVGQSTWTSLLNGSSVFASEIALLADGSPAPSRPGLDKELTGLSPCYRLYETQSGWIQVAAVTQEQWRSFCNLLGKPALADDADLATFEGRVARREEISPVFEKVLSTRTALVWQQLFDQAGVPAEISVDTLGGSTFLHDADNVRLGLVAEYEHPKLGKMSQFGDLFNFSRTSTGGYTPPPLVGQHTAEILTRFGFSAPEIEDLVTRGIAYQSAPDVEYPWVM